MFEKLHFVSSLKTSKLWRNDIISSGDHHGFMRIFSSARYCGISKFSFMGQIAFTLCCFLSLEVAEMIWILGQDYYYYSEKPGLFWYYVVLISAKPWHVGKKKKDRGHACEATASQGRPCSVIFTNYSCILRVRLIYKVARYCSISRFLETLAFLGFLETLR